MATKRKVIIENEASESGENESNSDAEETPVEEFNNDSSSNDEDMNEDTQSDEVANTGWADSIAKILKTNKPKGKKTLVLSKAKKLTDVRKTKLKDAGFEVQAEDGKIKREQIEEPELSDEDETEHPLRKKRKELPTLRVKPNILEKDRERTLAKIATKGVVQLFNAVKKQQKDIDTKLQDAGPLEVKRDKVLKSIDKREFLNVLMGDKSQSVKSQQNENVPVQNKSIVSKEEPTWSVLREDFMMGAKMKDWDKELEDEEENEAELESE